MSSMKAVFFDVDFTLIYPGPKFGADGYRAFASRHAMFVDPLRFDDAVSLATGELDQLEDDIYRSEPFVRYAKRVLVEMGAMGPGLDRCAREIYDEWALCDHFTLYDDVKPAFIELGGAGYRIGLISNTHRCLNSFQSYFGLKSYVSAAVSSSDHGYLKPHSSIFLAALDLLGVSAENGVMVGDSIAHDVVGAQKVGMAAVLLDRSGNPRVGVGKDVPVISLLTELPLVLAGRPL